MASSLLLLIDDIATVLDDVAVLTKVAAKKTSGVLGDDLALNAQQVIGVSADRELPIVWAVGKGSLLNKIILVPLALLISAFVPALITPLLMIGGAYLCFEGFEKIWHVIVHSKEDGKQHHKEHIAHLALSSDQLINIENEKIKGAIRTDFILSAEIIAITLGTVQASSIGVQFSVLTGISLLMTIGVYGFVALIVKIDDAGLYLVGRSQNKGPRAVLGNTLLKLAPLLMKFLSIAGTAAMFLVGGGIFHHGLPWLQNISESLGSSSLVSVLFDGAIGISIGLLSFVVLTIVQKTRGKKVSSQ